MVKIYRFAKSIIRRHKGKLLIHYRLHEKIYRRKNVWKTQRIKALIK